MGRMHVHVRLLACVWLVVGRLLAGVLLVVWRRLAWVLMVRLLARVLLLVLGRLLGWLLARDRLALHHLSLVGGWLLWVALLRITLLRITLLTVAALHRRLACAAVVAWKSWLWGGEKSPWLNIPIAQSIFSCVYYDPIRSYTILGPRSYRHVQR